jgi:hypothetical protein
MENDLIITEVILDGNKRTKIDYFRQILSDSKISTQTREEKLYREHLGHRRKHLKHVSKGEFVNFFELKNKLSSVAAKLEESQLFDNVDVIFYPADMNQNSNSMKEPVKVTMFLSFNTIQTT